MKRYSEVCSGVKFLLPNVWFIVRFKICFPTLLKSLALNYYAKEVSIELAWLHRDWTGKTQQLIYRPSKYRWIVGYNKPHKIICRTLSLLQVKRLKATHCLRCQKQSKYRNNASCRFHHNFQLEANHFHDSLSNNVQSSSEMLKRHFSLSYMQLPRLPKKEEIVTN